MHSVCDPELPDAGDVWGGVVEKSVYSSADSTNISALTCLYPYQYSSTDSSNYMVVKLALP